MALSENKYIEVKIVKNSLTCYSILASKRNFFDFALHHIFCINMLGFAYIYSVTASFLHNCFAFVLKFLLRL